MQNIRNIIFDLGGVLLDIDLKRTELAFAELGIGNFKEYYTLQSASTVFEGLELGPLTPRAFCEEFRKIVQLPLTDEQIETAWNTLAVGFDQERIAGRKDIPGKDRVYLVPNHNGHPYQTLARMFE